MITLSRISRPKVQMSGWVLPPAVCRVLLSFLAAHCACTLPMACARPAGHRQDGCDVNAGRVARLPADLLDHLFRLAVAVALQPATHSTPELQLISIRPCDS